MKYRAEIDGLRALAVVPVILFHAGFELFSGGFVGVDVFFVISGYLITTILVEDIENNRFSIVNFYERRARRILPALFFVMLVCIPFAWMWMLPSQMEDFSQSLVAVSLFASNILFWRESGYFAAASEAMPLLHTWSLAVEEQYYVLFPIFLVLAWRFGKNRVFWMIVVLAAISLALSEWGWRSNKATANFYLAPTRAWELFAGSIAAFVVQKRGVQANNTLSLIGLAAIVLSFFAYDETTPFPSVYALVPVGGVVLLVLYASKETLAGKLLSTKAFVGIGLISYSAYLWHQPLFAFARIRLFEIPSLLLLGFLSAASLMLAVFSWRYVEMPFRARNRVSRRLIFSLACLVSGFFVTTGLAGHFYHNKFESYWLSQQTDSTRNVYSVVVVGNPAMVDFGANNEGVQDFGNCRFNVGKLTDEIEQRLLECNERHGAGVLILGDSHAIDLYGVVASRFDNSFLVGVTGGGCRPHSNHDYCHYNRVKDFIEHNDDVFVLVIFEQAGFYLLQSVNGKRGSRKMFNLLNLDAEVKGIVVDEEYILGTANYLNEVSEFVRVKWFLPRVEPHISDAQILSKGCDYGFTYRVNQYAIFTNLDTYIEQLPVILHNNRLEAISQNKVFSFDFPSDFLTCNAIYWSDGDHFSAEGESYFGKRLPSNFLE